MATVILSYSLRATIADGAARLFDERLQTLNKEIDAKIPAWTHAWLAENTPQKVLELQAVHKEFLFSGSQVRITVEYIHEGRKQSESMVLSTGSSFPSHPAWSAWHNNLKLNPKSSIYTELTDMLIKRREMQLDQQKLIEHINNIMRHCTTLKQVESIWPSVMDFVPERIKQRYHAPNPPRKKKEDLEALKTPDFTVALTKAKMLAAK